MVMRPAVALRLLLVGIATLVAVAGARAGETVETGSWWDAKGQRIADDEALSRLDQADVILLGEVHDSPETHERQLELLEALDGRVLLGLEQLDRGGEDRLDRLNRTSHPDGRARAEAGGFDFEGWGWRRYGGLFDWATANGAPIWPLNLSREKAMAVAMADGEGWRDRMDAEALAWIDELAPDLSLPESEEDKLVDLLERSHCREIPASMSGRMVRAQVARDVVMAGSLMAARKAYPSHRIVAVMGNQHARIDRGVGHWLLKAPQEDRSEIVSVGMIPVNHLDDDRPSDALGPDDAFELRLVMPEVTREDPCAAPEEGSGE